VPNLMAQVLERFPTPTASDAQTGPTDMIRHASLGAHINRAKEEPNGSLNPTWVEWLMGFPLGWTDLEPSGMPLCRKSSNSSGDASSKRKRRP
jgi:hypothetical protein